VRVSIERRPNLARILANVAWLFSDKVLRMGVGLFVGVWIARYLGPEQYGLLSFAVAFVGLFSVIAGLGLQGIVVRDIVQTPTRTSETLGTALALELLAGLVAFAFVIIAVIYLRGEDTFAKVIVVILGSTLIVKAGEVPKYWFLSRVLSKYTVWAENTVFLVIAAVKLNMILTGATLIAFVWVAVIEAVVVAFALFAMYAWKAGRLRAWTFSVVRAKDLLQNSWPLVLSGVAVVVYMKIDQIMLGQMSGDEAVGVYSAAARLSEVWYFIAVAIATSVFPALAQSKKRSETLYNRNLQKLYDLMVILALAVTVPLTLVSEQLVILLYGPTYASAGGILAVHIWAAVFVYLGKASSQWFFVENRQILIFQRSIVGAVANVVLNLWWIPPFGPIGAAYATVVSYAFVSVLYDAIQKETRPMFMMKLKAFNLFRYLRYVKHWNE
jgi:PST family polysaccharide transporter